MKRPCNNKSLISEIEEGNKTETWNRPHTHAVECRYINIQGFTCQSLSPALHFNSPKESIKSLSKLLHFGSAFNSIITKRCKIYLCKVLSEYKQYAN